MADVTPVNRELLVSRIAREVARNLVPIEMICERYGLSNEDYQDIIRHPMFETRLLEEQEVWGSSTSSSVHERIKAKTGTMIEESLLEVYDMIHDKSQPMASKIRALEWASEMAGFKETVALGNLPAGVVSNSGSGVHFNIYIGGEKQAFAQSAAQPKVVEGEAVLVDKEPVP